MKGIDEMVEELDSFADNSLSVTKYATWELSSYRPNSFFNCRSVHGETFRDVVVKAYKEMLKEKMRRLEDGLAELGK